MPYKRLRLNYKVTVNNIECESSIDKLSMKQTREFRTDIHICGPLIFDSSMEKGRTIPPRARKLSYPKRKENTFGCLCHIIYRNNYQKC